MTEMDETNEPVDKLVRKRWKDWKEFNYQWSHDSYDSIYRYWEYVHIRTPELHETGIKWKIIYQPRKDNYAFTREFDSYWKPIMKSLLDTNESNMDNIFRNQELSPVIEYCFVQIVAKYIGIEVEQFYNLPRRDPDKLRTLFEVSEMVYAMKDYTINREGWIKRNEGVMEMLKERREFKEKIRKRGTGNVGNEFKTS